MKIDSPALRVYATLVALSVVTILLAQLLVRPGQDIRPDRSSRGFDFDEPPAPASSPAAAGPSR